MHYSFKKKIYKAKKQPTCGRLLMYGSNMTPSINARESSYARQQHSAIATVNEIFSHCPEPSFTSTLFGGGAFPEAAQVCETLTPHGTDQYRASALFV